MKFASTQIRRRALLASVFLHAGLSCLAETFYVSPSGSDSNNGRSPQTAFATLQRSVTAVREGDEVLVFDGTYTGFNVPQNRSGTATAPITFRALGDNVIISTPNDSTDRDGINVEDASWVIIDGFHCRNLARAGIRLVNAHGCIVRNNNCADNGVWGIFTGNTDDFLVENNICSNSGTQHGIYISNSSDRSIVRNNISFNNGGAGLQINADASFPGDGTSSDPIIHNNIFYNNGARRGGATINLDGVVNATIVNNLLYEVNATGIALFRIDGAVPSTGARIYHNTIINSSTGRSCIIMKDGSNGADIRNNIIYNPRSSKGVYDADTASLAGLTSDYNVVFDRFIIDGQNPISLDAWRNQTSQDTHSILISNTNNLFVDEANADYRLREGSIAVDKAPNIQLELLNIDLAGNMRPQGGEADIGAYELSANSLSYSSWLQLHFTNSEIGTGIEDKNADPDADGLINMIEYIMGHDPRTFTSQATRLITGNNGQLNFQLFNLAEGVTVHLQQSQNLSGWEDMVSYTTSPSAISRQLLSGEFTATTLQDSDITAISESFPAADPKTFLRLHFTEN